MSPDYVKDITIQKKVSIRQEAVTSLHLGRSPVLVCLSQTLTNYFDRRSTALAPIAGGLQYIRDLT